MHKDKDDAAGLHRSRDLTAFDHTPLDGEMFLQALNGFLMILTCDGEVFFATHSIEGYLGFHQSDIVHQSVYELVHSEDREELQRQLMWNSFLPPESANMGLQDVLQTDNCHLLERSFTVRFRCLLDNTSGFLRLDIRGRVKVLHGQNRKAEEPPLGLFAICTPFGPPSLLEIPQKEVMFKSKHKLDLALVSMDQRGKILLGYTDSELASMGGYDLVHYDDLAYVASAHQELLKTGASGMIAYRFQTKDGQWQWLQTSSRLVYKNSKPDFVISTHRPLMEEEGRDLLGKRTMDFKVSYLDAGLPNNYFSETDQLLSNTNTTSTTAPARVNRRYKTQLRDFLSTCRTKRKLSHCSTSSSGQLTPPAVTVNPPTASVVSPMPPAAVDYLAADYNVYPTSYEHGLSYMGAPNFHQHSLYDNRYLAAAASTENLFHQYRPPIGGYYPDYPYVGNGFLDMPAHDPYQQVAQPAYGDASRGYPVSASWPYSVGPSSGAVQPTQVLKGKLEHGCVEGVAVAASPGLMAPKVEEVKADVGGRRQEATATPQHFSPGAGVSAEVPRQTVRDNATFSVGEVLMWGSNHAPHCSPADRSPPDHNPHHHTHHHHHHHLHQGYATAASVPTSEGCEALKGLPDISDPEMCKWNGVGVSVGEQSKAERSASGGGDEEDSPHHHPNNHHNHHSSRVVMVL